MCTNSTPQATRTPNKTNIAEGIMNLLNPPVKINTIKSVVHKKQAEAEDGKSQAHPLLFVRSTA